MKKFLVGLIIFLAIYTALCIFFAKAYGSEYESPMSIYHDNYFVAGDMEDQVKFQVSAKYSLFFPSDIGIYAGYTQVSAWHLYDKSAPFYDSNYMPELFLRFESNHNIFGIDTGLIDFIQLSPASHCSNGKNELASRSINTYYGEIQLSVGDHYNLGVDVKAFNYYNQSKKNRDIEDYKSYYEADIFFKIKSVNVYLLDKEELHFKFGGFDKSDYDDYKNKEDIKGWYCIETQFRIVTSYIQPKLFVQYYHGYNEFMLDYNKKTEAIRVGLVF